MMLLAIPSALVNNFRGRRWAFNCAAVASRSKTAESDAAKRRVAGEERLFGFRGNYRVRVYDAENFIFIPVTAQPRGRPGVFYPRASVG